MSICLKHDWLGKFSGCPECRKENLPEPCPHSHMKCAVCRLEEAEARIETLETELLGMMTVLDDHPVAQGVYRALEGDDDE